MDVPHGTVRNHDGKEYRVEPGKGTLEAGDECPRQSEKHIAAVMNFASQPVPSINKNGIALLCMKCLWIVNLSPRKLGERFAVHQFASLHHAEGILLAVCSVPDPVDADIRDKQYRQCSFVPRICRRVATIQVQNAVAVRHRDTGHVPEDQQESQFLLVHVPCGGDEVFCLGTGVGVKEVRHDKEQNLTRNISVEFILASRSRAAQTQEHEPWDTDFVEHLKVKDPEHTWVQFGSHEEVIDWVPGDAVLGATSKCREISEKAGEEPRKNRHRHQRTKLIQDSVNREKSSVVESGHNGNCEVQATVG